MAFACNITFTLKSAENFDESIFIEKHVLSKIFMNFSL